VAVKKSGLSVVSEAVGAEAQAIEAVYRARYGGFRNALATVTGSYDSARDAVQEGFAIARGPAYVSPAARSSNSWRSRVLRVIEAASSSSDRASSWRPSLARRSPRTLDSRW
jgi:DNA-directed RNA polymerase specialized sigma24 family protein